MHLKIIPGAYPSLRPCGYWYEALGFAVFFGLSLFAVLALSIAMAGVAGMAGVAIKFFYGLNPLFDAAAAPAAGLLDFLSEKLLLIFFFCFLTNHTALRSFLRLLCLEASNGVEMKDFSVSLNFSMR